MAKEKRKKFLCPWSNQIKPVKLIVKNDIIKKIDCFNYFMGRCESSEKSKFTDMCQIMQSGTYKVKSLK